MCTSVLKWIGVHPDDEPGFVVLVARLQALVTRIGEVVATQRSGLVDSSAATARRVEIRARVSVHIAHLAEIGGLASVEQHELGKLFRLKPMAQTFAAFRSAAGTMFAEAQSHREVLVRYGLSAPVLEEFGHLLEEFDAAVSLGQEGRLKHTAATRELHGLTLEARKLVRAMDARNRQRFQNEREALEQWISARTVLGTPRGPARDEGTPGSGGEGGQPNVGGEERPAA